MTEQTNSKAEETRKATPVPTDANRPARQDQRRPARQPAAPVNDAAGDDSDDYNVPAEFSPDSVSRPRRIGSNIRINDIDYKNVAMLTRFIDGRGRILSRRKTRVSAKVQRRIVTAIKRARHLALLPYTADQSRIVRKRR
jgi:small subunit ribosomal protein S18